ncbi:WD repeat protein [Aspergillus sclerotioniger CBS 115572]|uniref:WD repeat protein n=1 Tax=Aspergillus sclerotioniger CBS 115572 TaxID=1450535 RepID=A0A317WPV4_9EURO|nr:WD repeat protein [Aspergillus sclerotioniger CBS 115572]PWY87147.1 WD repeat protein [Aspergillus sclerotioniger CBS 115572]
MNSYLLNRALGSISPSTFHVAQTSRLIQHLEPAPGIRFSSRKDIPAGDRARNGSPAAITQLGLDGEIFAHKAGVNVLAIDQYDGRFMVSGGADPSVHLWDLETRGSDLNHVHHSVASVNKASHEDAHTRAITSISIYPFDPTPSTILTTSYDGTLKLSVLAPGAITPVHTFNLDCTPYTHSLSSNPNSPLLIAVGTSEKPVRLLDLRSGLSTHGLPGHDSAVLSVSWAPHQPHILASASADSRVILFDIRRGGHNSAIAALDMDDAVGLDARIRVWKSDTGANTFVHFGPRVRNSATAHLAERAPLIVPRGMVMPGQETLLWPNFNDRDDRGEIFMFDLHEGTFVKLLRVPGLMIGRQQFQGRTSALSAARINSLAWRGNGASGEGLEMFSAHGDGTIRTWVSREPEGEPDEADEAERADRKRKRDVLDEIYRGFIG